MFQNGFILSLLGILAATEIMADQPMDYERDVQPILQKHCLQCHGGEERNGGISFEDQATLFAAADSGEQPIVAGKPERSELIKRVSTDNEETRMPPEGQALSGDEIQLLSRWISEGAKAPEVQKSAQTKPSIEHWSFRPLSKTEIPSVADQAWARKPIDCFIQSHRQSQGLEAVADADPTALIRRLSYDLTGLPPTPQESLVFVAASQTHAGLDSAVERLVDDLLSRKSYGERWGRHWMDWVRYADTAGDNSDYPIPQAYLYRNYIIESFNNDVPYDRFLKEQLAGDLLPYQDQADRNRQIIATGYLAMARRFGSLVERYPWHLTIEDTIDNLGRTVLGLTVSCARCHDHKFDPITTRDYYGLYGFFASTRYPFPGIELFKIQNDFVSLLPDAEKKKITEPYQEVTDRLTAELNRLLAEGEQQKIANASDASSASLDEQRRMKEKLDAMLIKARKAGEKLAEHLKTIPEYPMAYAVSESQATNARIQIKGEPDRLGAEVPRKFIDVLGGQQLPEDLAKSGSGRLELANWIASPDNPLTARVIVNRVWQRHFGTGLVPSVNDFGTRGELPTHPELLDWLANEFIRSGWSIKQLHRLILNSRTYRLSSLEDETNIQRDPTNLTYWKFNRQRLDAESIRDTLLQVSGSLDPSTLEQPHPFPPRQEWEYTQHHPFKDDYASNLRSVYLMTKRLTAKTYFQTFDGADPNVCTGDRDQSVTALQALYFLNDEFVHEQANRLADQLLEGMPNDELRLKQAFSVILCRQPSNSETNMLINHLVSVRRAVDKHDDNTPLQAERQAWSSVMRSLLQLNEFLYLD
jgi:mono/diheme cytochrome c family protein